LVNSSWKDLDVHGRRLNKILKILDKKFDKVPKDDIDGLARIAATIGNVTRQTIEIIKIVDLYEEIKQKHNEDMKEVRQQEAILKKWESEELQRKKHSIQNEIRIKKMIKEQHEIARKEKIKFDERNARYEREKMKGLHEMSL